MFAATLDIKNIFATQILKKYAESSINRKFVKIRSKKTTQTNSAFATFKANYKSNRKYILVSVNNKSNRFRFDTTSDITLISQSSWKSLGKPCQSERDQIARSTSGDQIHLTGELTCNVTFQPTTFSWVCYLAKNSELNLIGLDWINLSVLDIEKHFTDELKY